LSAVLLGTIGGFGSLFALLVSPVIRTYCRLNVFIAFISLFAFALASDRFMRFLRFSGPRIRWAVLLFVLAMGLYDEASIYAVPAYDEVKADYSSDAWLIHQVEDLVPAEAMIFQLPFQSFPDAPSVQRLESYDLVRPYLHSRSLRWSFGSMRGREGEAWHRDVSALPTADMLRTIKSAGFAGVLIDRFGYVDQATALERDIGAALGAPPLVSANQRLSFFKLAR
jgi:phosphoglycerol transferase